MIAIKDMKMPKDCSECPVNAKCGICEVYINWIKEHRTNGKND